MTLTRPRLLGLILAAAILIADQALKWLMIGPLALRERGHIDLSEVFDLTWTENRGVSGGLFNAETPLARWLLVALTAAIAITVLVWLLREILLADIFPLAMVLGGAVGNIIDRTRFGYVVDFADFHLERYFPFLEFDLLGWHFNLTRPFLVFNLADAAITLGVVFLLARGFLMREKRPNSSPETKDA